MHFKVAVRNFHDLYKLVIPSQMLVVTISMGCKMIRV